MQTILIIGYGNMAGAIARGLSGTFRLEICGRDVRKAKAFIEQHQLQNAKAIPLESSMPNKPLLIDVEGKIVLLCIKPYGLSSFCYKGRAKSLYSVLAGVSIATLASFIDSKALIRLMPNIGAQCALSATAVFGVDMDMLEARTICEAFGSVVFVGSEALIDSSIATSGSASAFLALIAQALIDAGVREGLLRKDSATLVQKTFEGVGALLQNTSPQEIIDTITTPGGTTAEGLSVLESQAVRGALIQACHKSVKKAKAMQKQATPSKNLAISKKA